MLSNFGPFRAWPRISAIARPFNALVLVIALNSLLVGVLESASVGMVVPLLDSIHHTGAVQGNGLVAVIQRFGHQFDLRWRLVLIGCATLGLLLGKNLLQVLGATMIAWTDGRIGHNLRIALAERLLNAPHAFHLANDKIKLVNIVATDSWRTVDMVRHRMNGIAAMGIAAAFLVMLLLADWQLTAVVGVGAAIAWGIQRPLHRLIRAWGVKSTEANDDLATAMHVTVFGHKVVTLFRQQQRELDRFSHASQTVSRTMMLTEVLMALLPSTIEVLLAAVFLTLLIAALIGGRAFAPLAMFVFLLNRLQPHLRAIESANAEMERARHSVDKVEWLLGQDAKPAPGVAAQPLRRQITLEEVSFSYPGRESDPALNRFSATIPAGATTALVGRSGAGKSTLMALLCRLVDPDKGRILVDGADLRGIDQASWLDQVAIAGQDIDLMDDTIATNIAYGVPSLSQAEIEAVAVAADAHAFIMALPDGYQTRVGDGGEALSGGQRQRIGVARALARKPSLLILDEATSAVDKFSEDVILRVLELAGPELTIIAISHHEAVVGRCRHRIALPEPERLSQRADMAQAD